MTLDVDRINQIKGNEREAHYVLAFEYVGTPGVEEYCSIV